MKIGDVARRSGVSARMLRYYDRIGLVQPSGRTRGGYRDYDDSDLRRLLHVEALRSLGLPLRQVAHVLDDAAATPTEILDRVIARTAEAITREQELLARLLRLRDQQPEAWADVLSTVSLLQRLGSSSASERQRAALTDPRPPIPSALAEAALTEDDPNVAGALQWALARSADDATLAALGDALESGDPDTRRRAITALVKIASPSRPGLRHDRARGLPGRVRSGPRAARRATTSRRDWTRSCPPSRTPTPGSDSRRRWASSTTTPRPASSTDWQPTRITACA